MAAMSDVSAKKPAAKRVIKKTTIVDLNTPIYVPGKPLAIYIVTDEEHQVGNKYKVGKTTMNRKELLARYDTGYGKTDLVLYIPASVGDEEKFHSAMTEHRIENNNGNGSEAYKMDIRELIRRLMEIIGPSSEPVALGVMVPSAPVDPNRYVGVKKFLHACEDKNWHLVREWLADKTYAKDMHLKTKCKQEREDKNGCFTDAGRKACEYNKSLMQWNSVHDWSLCYRLAAEADNPEVLEVLDVYCEHRWTYTESGGWIDSFQVHEGALIRAAAKNASRAERYILERDTSINARVVLNYLYDNDDRDEDIDGESKYISVCDTYVKKFPLGCDYDPQDSIGRYVERISHRDTHKLYGLVHKMVHNGHVALATAVASKMSADVWTVAALVSLYHTYRNDYCRSRAKTPSSLENENKRKSKSLGQLLEALNHGVTLADMKSLAARLARGSRDDEIIIISRGSRDDDYLTKSELDECFTKFRLPSDVDQILKRNAENKHLVKTTVASVTPNSDLCALVLRNQIANTSISSIDARVVKVENALTALSTNQARLMSLIEDMELSDMM